MYVYLYADWIDYVEETCVAYKMEKREKKAASHTKFRRSITCYSSSATLCTYTFMYRFARVESALALQNLIRGWQRTFMMRSYVIFQIYKLHCTSYRMKIVKRDLQIYLYAATTNDVV